MKYFFTTFVFILAFSINGISQTAADDFVTVWNLSNSGTGPNQIKFSIQSDGEVTYTWATIPLGNSGSGVLVNGVNTISGLPTGATIELRIQPINLNSFIAADGTQNSNSFDYKRLKEIKQWGTVQWKNFRKSFIDCENLVLSTTDLPILGSCTDMSEMFRRCTNLVATDNISNWDVSNVTDMFKMFSGATSFNKNISNWNVSNVTNMSFMFYGNTYFNSEIGNWNVGKVTHMSSMFAYAKNFNGNLSNWNVSNVTDMNNMFAYATNFNNNISNWAVANVTDMSYMFSFASAFNYDVSNWEITKVLNMSGMFKCTDKFNQNLEKWILKMNPAVNLNDIFSYSGFKSINYDKFLIGLNNSSLLGRPFGANALEFCTASTQRMSLISKGWTISGDTQYCPSDDFVIILDGLKLEGWASNSLILDIEGSGSIKYYWTATIEGASGSGYLTNGRNYIQGLSQFSKIEFRVNSKNLLYFKMVAGPQFYINYNSPNLLLDITQWGNAKWKSFEQSFINCKILNITATDIPNLSNCTSLNRMFMDCYKLVGPTNINNWNVSNISNMVNMFANAKNFNQDISDWNINKVTDMSGMFYSAIRFNQNLSKWGLKINPAINMSNIFDYSALDLNNYDAIINSFDTNGITGRNLGANTLSYCNSLMARNNLIGKGWNIIGDELQCNPALNDFVTLWDLSKPGSGSNQIKFNIQAPIDPFNSVEIFYSWNTIPSGPSGAGSLYNGDNVISGLPNGKTIELRIKFVKLEAFKANNDELRLIDIKQWGKAAWTNFYTSFYGCSNLDISATDLPNLRNCTTTAYMFNQCSSLTGPQNINLWNVSNIEYMNYMFSVAENFNQKISDWNVSKVINMGNMFYLAYSFNQDISNWNVGNVTDMSQMFYLAKNFNQDISSWNISKVSNMFNMFSNSYNFNKNLGNWGSKLNSNVNLGQFLDYTGLSQKNYDATLKGFDVGGITGRKIGVYNLKFCAANTERANLIAKGWTFSGDALKCIAPIANSVNNNLTAPIVDYQLNSNDISITVPPQGDVANVKISSWPAGASKFTINSVEYTKPSIGGKLMGNLQVFPLGGVLIPTNEDGIPTVPLAITSESNLNGVTINYVAVSAAGTESTSPAIISLSYTSALPLKIISFSGQKTTNGSILLKWEASHESNFAGFEVQNSANGIGFEKIGWVSGNLQRSYQFEHYNPNKTPIEYYRLKMIDLDGNFKYSKTIAISNREIEINASEVYPNPVIGEWSNIDLYSPNSGSLQTQLYSINNQLLISEIFQLNIGKNTLPISFKNIKKGIYLLRVQTTNKTFFRKVYVGY